MRDRGNLDRAIHECGLTFTEVADRAGFAPDDLDRLGYGYLPEPVLTRLADVVGLPGIRHPGDDAELPSDPSVLGAYLGEFPDGLYRDTLAESLGWKLERLEGALAALDAGLRLCGLRLKTNGGRVALAGRTRSDGRPDTREYRAAAGEARHRPGDREVRVGGDRRPPTATGGRRRNRSDRRATRARLLLVLAPESHLARGVLVADQRPLDGPVAVLERGAATGSAVLTSRLRIH